jgi:hypothetical protein
MIRMLIALQQRQSFIEDCPIARNSNHCLDDAWMNALFSARCNCVERMSARRAKALFNRLFTDAS